MEFGQRNWNRYIEYHAETKVQRPMFETSLEPPDSYRTRTCKSLTVLLD